MSRKVTRCPAVHARWSARTDREEVFGHLTVKEVDIVTDAHGDSSERFGAASDAVGAVRAHANARCSSPWTWASFPRE